MAASLLLSLFHASVAAAATPPKPRHPEKELARQLETLRAALKIPGVSAAVVREGRVIWSAGLGMADIERRIPAAPQTLYPIASLTKPIAAALLMQLVESERVSLDDPMSSYSAAFTTDDVKVRHLLTHTSEGTPGEKYRYSGDRFAQLDDVLERASAKPLRQLFAENVLDAAAMTSSVPGHDVLDDRAKWTALLGEPRMRRYTAALERLAKPYTLYGADESILSPYPPRSISAAAGLLSTVLDLARFDAAMDRDRLVRADTKARMFTPAVSNAGTALPYGLGWFVQNYRGTKVVWHYGQWQMFSSLILKVPERKLTLILLANSSALSSPFSLGAGDVTASPFAAAFFHSFIFGTRDAQVDGRAVAAIDKWLADRRSWVRKEIAIDSERLAEYVGTYALGPSQVVTVSREGDKLMIETPLYPRVQIFPESETSFFVKVADAGVTFVRDDNGRISRLVIRAGRQEYQATRK
jgi:CubicO group peptidase (beta-lactamase class C family)